MTTKELIQKLSEYPDDCIVGVDENGWWHNVSLDTISITDNNVVTLIAIRDSEVLTGDEYNQKVEQACKALDEANEALRKYFQK